MKHTYQLIDSGNGRKLEQFGPFKIARPASQAVWKPKGKWSSADAIFTREPDSTWKGKENLPENWHIEVGGIQFKMSPTEFGHLGIFPEQAEQWRWIQQTLKGKNANVLNLFAYSGGSTLAAAKSGAAVCHLDASRGMVAWARDNAELNHLSNASIRWIVDDAIKFLKREVKRGNQYDAIILDPPTFGRGAKGEVFKIERDIQELLHLCRTLLTANPLFILFSCHTPGFTPTVLHHLLKQTMQGVSGRIEVGEMALAGEDGTLPLPSGNYARWTHESL